jgi:uncharacterized protein
LRIVPLRDAGKGSLSKMISRVGWFDSADLYGYPRAVILKGRFERTGERLCRHLIAGAGSMEHQLTIVVYAEVYAICQLEPQAEVPAWAAGQEFVSITRTEAELSIVCRQELVPGDVRAEKNRRLMRIEGKLGFELTGVLASVTAPLSVAKLSIFTISTYDTDYLFIADEDLQKATEMLEAAGHTVRQSR